MKQWIEFDPATGDILQCGWGSSVIPPEETDTRGVLLDQMADVATQRVNPVTRVVESKP
jgi:hypothetical protein